MTPLAMNRRRVLTMLGGLGVLAACGSDDSGSSTTAATTGTTGAPSSTAPSTTASSTTASSTSASATAAAQADLTTTPGETGGPFPADGSNDNGDGDVANVLADPRSVRSDIRSDLDGSNTQEGVPLTLKVNVQQKSSGSALANAAIYVWHCNKAGEYSAYSSQMLGGDFSDRSFLRGVQVTDGKGDVTFQTVLPGRYPGRAFHIHFEVYGNAEYDNKLLTSQMAMDDDLIDSIYEQAGYTDSLRADTDNAQDGVFADGVEHQLLAVTGDVNAGLTASFTAVV